MKNRPDHRRCTILRQLVDLYRCRWQIEVFFKQIKQTLQRADFLGPNANAVKWQPWMARLVYVLLRAALWQARDLSGLLEHQGTA